MADISLLGELNPVQPLDLSKYKDQTTGFTMPKSGRYVVKAPDSFLPTAYGKTRNGDLKIEINPTIVGPTNEGFTLRRQSISAKAFDRSGTQVSQVGDYLRALGYTGATPTDPQEIADLVEKTAGSTYEAILDWEANHFASGFSVKGMRNFPTDGKGGYQSWVEHPTEKNSETGEPLRLRANLVISKFVAKA